MHNQSLIFLFFLSTLLLGLDHGHSDRVCLEVGASLGCSAMIRGTWPLDYISTGLMFINSLHVIEINPQIHLK